MKIDRDKTFTTLFTLSTKVKPVKIMLNHTELQHIDSATYLGVTFDRRKTWKPHICNAETKTRRKLALLRKLSGTQWGAAEVVLKNVYIGTIRPHLNYGSTTSNYTLDKVQNQALRIITRSMRSNLVQQTKPDKFIGENQLGKVLHRIRTQVEQLTAINNSSHDCIVLDMPAPPVSYCVQLILRPLHHHPLSR